MNKYIIIASLCLMPFIELDHNLHERKFGHSTMYSNKIPLAVLKNYPDIDCFTTINSGGWILYNWYPHKMILMDGQLNHKPARLINDYNKLWLGKITADKFCLDYALQGAIIDHASIPLMKAFKGWHPRYIDKMGVFFLKEECELEVLEDLEVPDKYAPYIKNTRRVLSVKTRN